MPTRAPLRRVRFELRSWGDGPAPARELLPFVDEVSLVDLIRGYELAAGYDTPGAYAGIVLDYFNFGDLSSYLAGEPESAYFADRGIIALLGCDCGEVGCSPLGARVTRRDGLVTWHSFAQPSRSDRDYRAFGPFIFHGAEYVRAIHKAAVASAIHE